MHIVNTSYIKVNDISCVFAFPYIAFFYDYDIDKCTDCGAILDFALVASKNDSSMPKSLYNFAQDCGMDISNKTERFYRCICRR